MEHEYFGAPTDHHAAMVPLATAAAALDKDPYWEQGAKNLFHKKKDSIHNWVLRVAVSHVPFTTNFISLDGSFCYHFGGASYVAVMVKRDSVRATFNQTLLHSGLWLVLLNDGNTDSLTAAISYSRAT